ASRPRGGRGVEVERDSRVVSRWDRLHGRDLQERGEDDLRQGGVAGRPFGPVQLEPGRQRQARHRFSRRREDRREGSRGPRSLRRCPEYIKQRLDDLPTYVVNGWG